MKILNLRCKNLSSLKGEWEIHFDQPPLSDAGVFAITGPNGSGKTTILDSITLALYGETFRLQQPALEVLTKQTEECYAEVTFSLGGEVYRSRWGFKKSDDQAEPVEMALTHLNGEETLLESKPNTVRAKVTELTGLDFSRFTRSIMLAQGDFAAFLYALDNERADILEKITGVEVYEAFATDFIKEVEHSRAVVAEAKEALSLVSVLDETRKESLEEEHFELEEHCDHQQATYERLASQREWHTTLKRLDRSIKQDQTNLYAARQLESEHETDLSRIERAHKAALHQADLDVFDDQKRFLFLCDYSLLFPVLVHVLVCCRVVWWACLCPLCWYVGNTKTK